MRKEPFQDPEYSYDLPSELIASAPAEPRDSARLFSYEAKTGRVSFDTFSNLDAHLPSPALLVLNETKVVPARVMLQKESGSPLSPRLQRGKVEALFLLNEWKGGSEPFDVLVDRKVNVGDKLYFEDNAFSFEAIGQNASRFSLKPLFPPEKIFGLLEKYGKTPVPKYIKGVNLEEGELRRRYQTVFAQNPASVAAPTASLHFTERVFEKLEKKDIGIARISLHVGLGTFAPITEGNRKEGKLHLERFSIPAQARKAIFEAKKSGIPVVAVGTTVVRALESAADEILKEGDTGISGETDIFIRPPFDFRIADALATNFHLPNSSLMMLVEAFLGHKKSSKHIQELYEAAVREKFRFYSFGDAMLIA